VEEEEYAIESRLNSAKPRNALSATAARLERAEGNRSISKLVNLVDVRAENRGAGSETRRGRDQCRESIRVRRDRGSEYTMRGGKEGMRRMIP
jgi:hypothetical protein